MNPTQPRLQRVTPARGGPVRNRLMNVSRNETAPTPQATAPAAAAELCGALENGVRTAYAVIDEYMKRGYEAARHNNPGDWNERGSMNDKKTNYGFGFPGMPPNLWGPMQPLAEQWMSAMTAWTQAWSAFMPGMFPQQQGGYPGAAPYGSAGFNSAAPPTSTLVPVVSVLVSSPLPCEVTVNLHAGADMVPLSVDPLACDGARIEGVTIMKVPGRLRLSIQTGPQHAAGCYRGAIRKRADGTVCGEVVAVLSDPAAGS